MLHKLLFIFLFFLCINSYAQKSEFSVFLNKNVTTISGNAIDFSNNNLFQKTLTENTTFTFSNFPAYQWVSIYITNPSSYTVTWPSILWQGVTAPTQSTDDNTDEYRLIKIGNLVYGYQNPFSTTPTGNSVYYFSSDGSDSNTGLDSTEAFLTIDKLESIGLLSGDTVRFRGSDTVKGSAIFTSINFSDITKKIVFNSYGSGKSYLKNEANDVVFRFNFIDIVRLEFKNLIFQGSYDPLTQTGGATDSKAIWVNNSNHNAGIAGDSMYVAIDSCEFYNYWHSGIYLYIMSSTKRGTYNITNNIVMDNGLSGINIWGIFYSNLNIVGNNITNIYSRDDETWIKGFGGIFAFFTRSANVAYNYIGNIGELTPLGSSGSHFTFCKKINMNNNVVDRVYASPTGGEGNGLYVDCGTDSSIFENNFVQNCQGASIMLANAPTSHCGLGTYFPGFTEDSLESSFNIARFNILITDSAARGGIEMYAKYQSSPNTIYKQKRNMIYNNLIYAKGGYQYIDTAAGKRLPVGIWQYGWSDSLYIFNNIFVMDSALAIQHDIPAGFGYPGTTHAEISNWVVTDNIYWQLNGLDNSIARQRRNNFNLSPFYFRYHTYQSIANWNDSTDFNPVYYNENPLINNLTTDYSYRNPYYLDTLVSFLYSNNITGTNFNDEVIRIADTTITDFYGLPIVDRIGPFQGSIIDSTFSIVWAERPVNFQLFARESNDSGDVLISGVITNTEDYFDTCLTQLYRNGSLIKTTYQNLTYTGYNANFSITNKIKAELAEYKIVLSLRSLSNKDSVLYTADSLVSGDVYVLNGQSNIQYSREDASMNFTNEYMRTFGIQTDSFNQKPYNVADTLWHRTNSYCDLSTGGDYFPYNIGAVGQYLQKYILDSFSIPTAVINGSLLNTSIKTHTRNNSDPDDLTTLYGKLLYRLQKAKVEDKIKVYLWYQGESDMAYAVDNPSPTAYYMNPRGLTDALNYPIYFDSLYRGLKTDYTFNKIFLLQNRQIYTYQFHQSRFREKQRQIDTIYGDTIDVIPTVGIGSRSSDMTHYSIGGYNQISKSIFRRLRQLYYTATDTVDMKPPSIRKAFYANDEETTIGMIFNGSNPNSIPSDSLGFDIEKSFYLDGVRTTSATSLTLSTNKDTMYLNLPSTSSASYISYLPRAGFGVLDIPTLDSIYNGPFIRNSKGIAVLTFDSIIIEPFPSDTLRWHAETRNFLDTLYTKTPFTTIDLERKWLIDSTIGSLKDAGIFSLSDVLFFMNQPDSITSKINWLANGQGYTFVRSGRDFTNTKRPRFKPNRGYFNIKNDSSFLTTNIITSSLANWKRDSGTVAIYSGDNVSPTNYLTNSSKIFGAYHLYTGIGADTVERDLFIAPYDTLTFSPYGNAALGRVNINLLKNTGYIPSNSAKGLYSMTKKTTDTVFKFFRNDTLKNSSSVYYPYHDLNHPIYLLAVDSMNVKAINFFTGRTTFFYIGGKLSTYQTKQLYSIVENWMVRTGGSYTIDSLVAVTLVSPTNNATGVSITPTLDWNDVPSATNYTVQLSANNTFSPIIDSSSLLTASTRTISSPLTNSTEYFWRVKARNVWEETGWTTDSFTTTSSGPDTTLWQTETTDFLARMYAITNCLTLERKILIDSVIVLMKASGSPSIWAKADAIHFLANCDTLVAHSNLKSSSYTLGRRSFSGGTLLTFTTDKGYYNSSQSNAYLVTGIVPSALTQFTQNGFTIACYNHKDYTVVNNSAQSNAMFGTGSGSGVWLTGFPFTSMNNSDTRHSIAFLNSSFSGGATNAAVVTDASGLYEWKRTSSTVMRQLKNGVYLDSANKTSMSPPTHELYLMAFNATYASSPPAYVYKGGLTFDYVGANLTAAQSTDLFTIVEFWMLTVGASYTTN